jgi:HlyD family secretion protein
MSGTVSRGREAGQQAAGQQAEALAAAGAGGARRRRRGGWVAAGLVVVLAAAGAVSAWRAGTFSSAASSGAGGQGAPASATAAVTRQDIAATTPVNATLGYAGSYPVTGQGGGTLTWLPPAGQVISQGQALYRVDNGTPVVLLYGSVPDWRAMSEGTTGADVTQLNHDLVRLGDASSADVAALGWDYFSWATMAGVEKLQSDLGVSSPSGSLSLGQVVFEPTALRVSQVTGSLGGPASGPVLAATSDRHVVTIPLDAAQQSQVKAGDKVTVTLPDGKTTPGVVSAVGTVATTSGSGSNATTTIPVDVKLTDPKAAGTLDQAPVTVNITTDSVKNALVVPVGALLAQASGGYAVEVVGPGNTRRYVPVTTGPIFDDADGLVQVTGALTPGQRVVVPAT